METKLEINCSCKGITEYVRDNIKMYDVVIQGNNALKTLIQIELKITGLSEKIFESGKNCIIEIKE